MTLSLLLYLFVASTIIQVIYYLFFSSFALTSYKRKKTIVNFPVSVIICAKNEAKNLQKLLPSILEQKYANFEIILINDASTDATLSVMETFKNNHSHIKIVDVKNAESFWGNKKYALTLGIKAATYNHLLFTDADCCIASKNWIHEMAHSFLTKKTIVLGYGKYERKRNSFLNLLIRFETFNTAIQYFSYAKLKIPYMGVGRNLAYHRSEFYKTRGFIKHLNIRSGDDDLFVQEAANSINTEICIDSDSFTTSVSPNSFKEWFRQKRRHISTASHYKFKFKFLLSLFFSSKALFYILMIPMLILFSWKLITPFVVAYFLTTFIIVGFSAKKLEEPTLIYFLPFLEISLILFQFSFFINNMISKPTHWK